MKFRYFAILFFIYCSGSTSAQNCGLTLTVPADITICEPQNIVLDGNISGTYFSHEWSGTDGYRNNTDLNPTIYAQQSATYTLKAYTLPTSNIIINGDFSAGNTGFTTNYIASYPGYTCSNGNQIYGLLGCEGTYFIGTNSGPTHTNFADCYDHTGGGNMMMVNGAASLQRVWCQNITVNPNRNYIFQAFATSIESSSPAILQFSINNFLLGSPFMLSGATCFWQEFYTTWNSGSNTSVEICITNQNTAVGGNDFAIDDLFFGEMCETKKDFTVSFSDFFLGNPTSPTLNCARPIATLSADPIPSQFNYSYLWETQNGTIQSGIRVPVITVSAAGTYTVTVTNHLGCTKTQTYVVQGNFEYPALDITGQTNLDCLTKSTTLNASSSIPGTAYSWILPNNTRVNGNTVTSSQAGIYTLIGTAPNSCITSKTIEVTRNNNQFVYDVDSSGVLTCQNTSVSIHIQNQTVTDSIRWTGPGIINRNYNQDSIIVNLPGMYLFNMYIGSDCIHTDSISIKEIVPILEYVIADTDTLTCRTTIVDISMTDHQHISRVAWWNQGKKVADSFTFSVDAPGSYYAVISDINGCTKTDTVTVISDYLKPEAIVKIDSIDCLDMLGGFQVTTDAILYKWQGNGHLTNVQNPTFAEAGIYSLQLTGENGCIADFLVELPSSIRFPIVTVVNDHITCSNPTGHIYLQSDIAAWYSWTGTTGTTGTGPSVISGKPDDFTIEATSLRGCKTIVTGTILIDTLRPQLNLTIADILTCVNTSVKPIISASGYQQIKWTGPGFSDTSSLVPTFTAPGGYQLSLTGNNGCITQKNITVAEDRKNPNFLASVKDIDCAHPDTEIVVNGDLNIKYSVKIDGNYIPLTSAFKINQAGKYLLRAVNNAGCDSITELTIKGYFDKPKVQLPSVKLNCNITSAKIYNQIQNNLLQYAWHTDKGIVVGDTLSVFYPGFVSLHTVNNRGCEKIDTIVISGDFDKPLFSLPAKSLIPCQQPSIKLLSSFSAGNYSYYWSGNTINNIIDAALEVSKPGIYTFFIKNNDNGCADSKSVVVDKQESPDKFVPDITQPLCYGDQAYLSVRTIVGGTPPYTISIDNITASIKNRNIITSGLHLIEITDANGCILHNDVHIDTAYAFRAHAGKSVTIPLYESYELQGSTTLDQNDIKSVIWIPPTHLTCDHCLLTIATPEKDMRYILTVTNQNGCVESDSVRIRVIFDKGFIAPNIISPYDGSQNNRFTIYPHRKSIDKIVSLQIYDRWGNLVFTRQNFEAGIPEQGWDGNFGNNSAQSGVFVWVAEILYKDGSKEPATGDVTLMK